MTSFQSSTEKVRVRLCVVFPIRICATHICTTNKLYTFVSVLHSTVQPQVAYICISATKMAGRNARNNKNKSNLEDNSDQLSSESKSIIKIMQEEFIIMKEEFALMKNEFLEALGEKTHEINVLNDEVKNLKAKVTKLESLIDEADSYERRDMIVVSGPNVPEFSVGENANEIVRDVVRREFNLEIGPNEINTSHRIGKKTQNQSADKRPFIVKLCRRDMKKELIMTSKRIKSRNIFISENLTPLRRSIFKTLRTMKREHPNLVKGVSTHEGKVFVYTKSESSDPNSRDKRHTVSSYDTLEKFCNDYIKRPLDNFLDNFFPQV